MGEQKEQKNSVENNATNACLDCQRHMKWGSSIMLHISQDIVPPTFFYHARMEPSTKSLQDLGNILFLHGLLFFLLYPEKQIKPPKEIEHDGQTSPLGNRMKLCETECLQRGK